MWSSNGGLRLLFSPLRCHVKHFHTSVLCLHAHAHLRESVFHVVAVLRVHKSSGWHRRPFPCFLVQLYWVVPCTILRVCWYSARLHQVAVKVCNTSKTDLHLFLHTLISTYVVSKPCSRCLSGWCRCPCCFEANQVIPVAYRCVVVPCQSAMPFGNTIRQHLSLSC